MFLAGLINFCGLGNLPLRVKSFICFLEKLGAWVHYHKIIGSIHYKRDNISGQYIPYNPNEEKDTYCNQLIETRNIYRKRIKVFVKDCFPYFVAITSIFFNIVQCVVK